MGAYPVDPMILLLSSPAVVGLFIRCAAVRRIAPLTRLTVVTTS